MIAALIIVTIAIIEAMALLFTLALFNAAAVGDAQGTVHATSGKRILTRF